MSSLCVCSSVMLSLLLYFSVLLSSQPVTAVLPGWQLKVDHISTDRNPQRDTNRQLGGVSDIAVYKWTIWMAHVGYPIRRIGLLGHTLKVSPKKCVRLCLRACVQGFNLPFSPCSLSLCQVSRSVHSWSGGGEPLKKGGLVSRGRVHRQDQPHRPHGQDI